MLQLRPGTAKYINKYLNRRRNNTACRKAVDTNGIDFRYHRGSEEGCSVMPRSELVEFRGYGNHCELGCVPGVWL